MEWCGAEKTVNEWRRWWTCKGHVESAEEMVHMRADGMKSWTSRGDCYRRDCGGGAGESPDEAAKIGDNEKR